MSLASALALAWHSAFALGGSMSPSQLPLHMTIAFASALHEARIPPSQPPDGFSTVHFRYIWAGQKTFTFFPKPEFMPKWIEREVGGSAATLKPPVGPV